MKGFRKYFVVLFITVAIFATAWYLSIYFNNRKINAIQAAQDKVTVDIMSSESQFNLLEKVSCQDINNNSLSQEISDLADQISYAEQTLNDPTQISLLKQQYSILEVKDFLLTQRISEQCQQPITTILYFYKNADTCADCTRQGYVLDALRQEYPQVRVYSFDTGLDSATIRALLTIYKIPANFPALVVNGKTQGGFIAIDDLEKSLPSYITNPTPVTASAQVSSPTISKNK
jgi:glutaredoxin-related protein